VNEGLILVATFNGCQYVPLKSLTRLTTQYLKARGMLYSLAKHMPRQDPVGNVLSVHVPSANEVLSRYWQRPLERQLHPTPQQKLTSFEVSQGRSVETVPLPV